MRASPTTLYLTFTMVCFGRAVHDVQAGTISINVTFAGTQIYEEVDDLCSKTSCPIQKGPLNIEYLQELPPIAPPVCGGGQECGSG